MDSRSTQPGRNPVEPRALRRTRQGAMVGLYKASETDLDTEAGAWL